MRLSPEKVSGRPWTDSGSPVFITLPPENVTGYASGCPLSDWAAVEFSTLLPARPVAPDLVDPGIPESIMLVPEKVMGWPWAEA